jgi:hypothetical protein
MSRTIPTCVQAAYRGPAATLSGVVPNALVGRRGKLRGSLDSDPLPCDSVQTIRDAVLGNAARPASSATHGTCDPFRRFRRRGSPPGLFHGPRWRNRSFASCPFT